MKHNRNQFNLLLERMSNRYSYDESIDLINKQLLTEGFGNKFFSRLKGIDVNLKTPQINRLQKVMGGLDEGLTTKNIDDLINAKGPDGNSGINLIKNDLKKSNISLSKIEENGLDNYFKVLGGVDDALKGNIDNSVIGVINKLDDTNLTLNQKQKYLTEVFEENPDLINMGMPDGKKIEFEIIDGRVRMKKNNIKDVVEENFIYLSSNSVSNFVNERIIIVNKKTASPKKIIKNNNFDSGDILISEKGSDVFFLMKAEDATTNVKTKLKNEGYDVISVDNPSGKFKNKVEGKSEVSIVRLEPEDVWKGIWFKYKKYFKLYGYITSVQFIGFVGECIYRMVFDDYKEYNKEAPIGSEDKYTITKNYDVRDCVRSKLVASQDPNNPDPISNMAIRWWEVFIPGGPIIPMGIMYLVGATVDFKRTVEDLNNLIAATSDTIITNALKNLSIKEIVNYDCEKASKDNIRGAIKTGSEEEIVNKMFEKLTGYGVINVEDMSDAIDEGIGALGGVKSDYEATMAKIDIEISNNNEGLDGKYKMQNFGVLERTKHFCRRKKLHFIKKKINMVTEQSKSSEGNRENWCGVNTTKLDIYSTKGFRITNDPKTEVFSVDDCKNTKKGIKQLIILAHNNNPEETEGLENIDVLSECSDAELGVLKSNQIHCYLSPEEDEELNNILDGLDNIEVTVDIHKKDVSNKYYDWQYDKDNKDDTPFHCADLQSIFIGQTNGNKKNEIITKLHDTTNDDGTIIEAELKNGVDWKVQNKRIVYNINEKNIRFFENNYTHFCSNGRRNTVNGVKKTKKDCINDLVTHVKTMSCWGKYYGT